MKRKIVSILLCAVMVAGLLSGCAKTNKTTDNSNNPAKDDTKTEATATPKAEDSKPAEINIFISQPEYADAINELIDAYKKVAPNVTLQFDGNRILEHADRLMRLKSRFVLDHHGKFFAGVDPAGPEIAAVKRLIDGGNCWFKFAGAYESSKSGPPDYADVAAFSRDIAAHAPERIIWGSNWPHNLAKTQADYPDDVALTDTVLDWLPNEAALRLALVDNPEELFGLPPYPEGD